jgi:hypothetical protein
MVPGVKALIFDVFGTLVDWRSSVAREAQRVLAPLGVQADWPAFADAWRGEYQGAMEEVRSGRLPFSKLDVLHRRNLDIVLQRLGGLAVVDVSSGSHDAVAVLAQLAPEDRVLVENLLLVAQAELEILNLASTTVVASESIVRVSCALAGPSPLVALSNMRTVQAYSPARVRDVRAVLQENRLLLVIDVHDRNARVTASEIDVVRLVKRRRML